MEGIQGKHFSITDPKDVKTVIYKINKTDKNFLKDSPKYTVERLGFFEELRQSGSKKTFFLDNPLVGENELLILSFGKEKVVVNMGILEDNKVTISKRPIPLKFQTLYSEEETEYKDFSYTPSLKRPISIIDPETTEEIKPILYFDEKTNDVKGKCKLKPFKSYFAFEIREQSGK